MDGRRFRKFCAFGALLVAAVGCHKEKVKSPLDQMPNTTGTPTTGVPTPSASTKPPKNTGTPTVPVEQLPPLSKEPMSADTLAALADVQVDAAFDEKTVPGSKEGLLDSARKKYHQALDRDPKNKAALLGMARFHARLGEREKAIDSYKKYLTHYQKDADVAHEVAVTHARWKDWAGAVSWCDYTLKLDPENRKVKSTKGFCLARLGKWEEAFAVMCQIMPEAQARYNLARALEHLNMADACRLQLHLALKADPGHAGAREFLAELDGVGVPPVGPRDDVRPAGALQPAP
jgi:tetratricopeptide (TPR) repeat protein